MQNNFIAIPAEEEIIAYFSNGFRVSKSKEGTITFKKQGVEIVDVVGFGNLWFYQIVNFVYYNDATNTKTFNFITHEIKILNRKYTSIINHYYVGDQLWIQEPYEISRVGERASFGVLNCEIIIKATDDYVVVCEPMHYDSYGYDHIYGHKTKNYKVFSEYNIHCSILKTSDLSVLHKIELNTIKPAESDFNRKTYKNYLNMIRESIIINKDIVEIYDVKFKLTKPVIEECCICNEDLRMVEIVPCKHKICNACVIRMKNCPLCRGDIQGTRWATQ